MKIPIAQILILVGLCSFSQSSKGQEAKIFPGKRSEIQFTKSPVQSSDPIRIRYRMMAAEQPPAYDVTQETFDVLLPKNFKANQPHGLFIWISAGDSPSIPNAWEPILAKHNLMFIGAKKSGNKRNIFDRIRMAIDANHNMRELYKIDGRRVYVSGFSGGSRVASMIGVAWGRHVLRHHLLHGREFLHRHQSPRRQGLWPELHTQRGAASHRQEGLPLRADHWRKGLQSCQPPREHLSVAFKKRNSKTPSSSKFPPMATNRRQPIGSKKRSSLWMRGKIRSRIQ